ncbi:MAG: DUF928 domain-containing protein [Leptolyngbyaceae cyanobacterium]
MVFPVFRQKLALLSLLGLLSTVALNGTNVAQAQAAEEPRQGFPTSRVGGGTRSNCHADDPLVALIPETGLLKVTAAQPSLWFYIPQSDALQDAEFILYNSEETIIYETTFTTAEESGLVELNLADLAPDLTLDPNQQYQWFLSLICPHSRVADLVVHGWVQPVELTQGSSPQDSNNQDFQANLSAYLENGFWSRALTLLTESHQGDPNNAAATNQWSHLIQSMSLPSLPLTVVNPTP